MLNYSTESKSSDCTKHSQLKKDLPFSLNFVGYIHFKRRRRFRISTRQQSWTRPVAWELIPMTALWAGEGGAQLSQHTAQVSRMAGSS